MAAAARAEALLEEVPEDLLARHPRIRAQVLAERGAVELWAGQLEEAAATFGAGMAAAAADGQPAMSTLTAWGISRSWMRCKDG